MAQEQKFLDFQKTFNQTASRFSPASTQVVDLPTPIRSVPSTNTIKLSLTTKLTKLTGSSTFEPLS